MRLSLERVRAAVVTLGFAVATLAPMVPDADGKRHDGFPFSWYPMFSQPRPAVERVTWVRAQLEDGSTRPVSVVYWTRGGLTEGRAQLEGAVRAGRDETDAFCRRLAARLARRRHGWEAEVLELELMRTAWRMEAYHGPEPRTPEAERTLHRCEVRR